MNVGWIYERRFLDHDTGHSHPDHADRLRAILRAVQHSPVMQRMVPLECRPATSRQLALVHDPAYIDIVRMMCEEKFTFIGDPDTPICWQSYDVAALASGAVLAACDAVMAERVRRVFCAVRPPGHHAEADQAMGFCLFNHVALGAKYLQVEHGVEKIAIVDFDAHHGNGTQHIFEDSPTVMYASLHERPGSQPFPGTGESHEIGRGDGQGFTLNLPLDRGAGESDYLAAIESQLLPALDTFSPDVLVFSAGFDALMRDRASQLVLRPESYGKITEQIVTVTRNSTAGRVVSVLEGGYDLAELGAAVVSHLNALLES
jgi:acetoin utilization deacetylase AcuC-like enzyme